MFNDVLLFKPVTTTLLGSHFKLVLPRHGYLSCQREAMGLSQDEVAVAAGIHLRQYQCIESGERSMTSTSLRIGLAICDVLKLDPHRFVPSLPNLQSKSEENI